MDVKQEANTPSENLRKEVIKQEENNDLGDLLIVW